MRLTILVIFLMWFASACTSQRLDSSFLTLFEEKRTTSYIPKEELYSPHSIAVLLPLSNPSFAGTAEAIQKGILAAYYQSHRPTLRFYDVSKPEEANNVYQKAVQDGAEVVIGPLTKESIEELVSSSSISVPTLTLNYSKELRNQNAQLFQFGLSPEDELVQLAHFAWKAGHHQAAIISLDDEWGKRLNRSFKEAWEQLGGKTNAELPLNANTHLSEALRSFLFPEVKAGFLSKQLKKSSGQGLYRKDIDFILLLMFPEQARQVLPLLKYYRAENIPVYATSHIYGAADPALNKDLEDLIFCDMPWVLQPSPSKVLDQQSRLYAMGFDAYQIIRHLKAFNKSGFRYSGLTGSLFIDEHQRFHRTVSWAKLQNGLPYLLK